MNDKVFEIVVKIVALQGHAYLRTFEIGSQLQSVDLLRNELMEVCASDLISPIDVGGIDKRVGVACFHNKVLQRMPYNGKSRRPVVNCYIANLHLPVVAYAAIEDEVFEESLLKL